MKGFRSGKTEILIATDVAARGIDVDDVEAVFNYDVPQDDEFMCTVSAVPVVPVVSERHLRLL